MNRNRLSRLLALTVLVVFSLAIGVSLRGQAPSAAAPNQSVDVLDLGPTPQTGGFAGVRMTADDRNIAIAGPSGSRMAAFLNGKPGEKYDQIQTAPPVLSPDGRRLAYAARKGSDWFVVVDGKEYGPYTGFPAYSPLPGGGAQPIPFQLTPNRPIVFSPDSKHVAFIANKPNQMVVVEDGKELSSQGQVDTTTSLQFSKQGDHLLYVARDGGFAWVVLDGVPGFKYMSLYTPQFSNDGHHLAYVAQRKPDNAGLATQLTLVFDGKEGPAYPMIGQNAYGVGILISPDGAHVAYPAHANSGQSGGADFVVIDGKAIPNATRVWMSPDGKSIAYLSTPASNTGAARVTVVANGKPGLEYAVLKDLHFAPDGHVIYSVSAANGKTFVVDGEKESDAYDDADLGSLHFSADGKHTAYVATANSKSFVVLDGKKMTLPPEYSTILQPSAAVLPGIPYITPLLVEMKLQFTPDGHIVYRAGRYGIPSMVKDDQILGDDGMVSPDGRRIASVKATNQESSTATAQVTLDGQTGPVFRTITRMTFSPDSKHFAYVGVGTTPIPNGTGKEGGYFLVVDGVQKGEYPEIRDLQFSPDSQHLFHFVTSHLNGGPGMAYMDQKLFYTFLWLPGFWNEWLDNQNTIQILGGKYDPATKSAADMEFYRVRYYLPGANRNQDTPVAPGTGGVDPQETMRMVGGGAAVSASAAAPAPAQPTAPAAQGVPSAAGNTAAPVGVPAGGQAGAPAAAGTPTAAAAPTPGTSVQVRLVDPVNTATDGAGKQYRAAVTKVVKSGPVTIVAGPATVAFSQNGTDWVARLTSVTINGQVVAVTSSPATVPASALQGAATTVNNALGSIFGHKPSTPVPAPVANGGLTLAPGTQFNFTLAQ